MTQIIQRTHNRNDAAITVARDAEGNPSRVIEGYAIRFNAPSVPFAEDDSARVVEYIAPEALGREFIDTQDVKMTLFHDMKRLLARSKRGTGSLSYDVDDQGVRFRFETPNTADGDMALELVERGDIDGCSFMFATYYNDRDFVSKEMRQGEDGKKEIVYTVRKIVGLYDFTLTPDPAYPDTSVTAAKRDISELQEPQEVTEEPQEVDEITQENEEKRNVPFCMGEYLRLIKLSNPLRK